MFAQVFPFLPAIFAAVTDLVVYILMEVYFKQHQPDYPPQVVIYQCAMFSFALLLAFPVRWVWLPACLLLAGGVFLAGFSIGMLYIPTLVVAGWVMVKRLEEPSQSDASV